MIRRTMDATLLNQVANHPDVRPWLGGEGPLDLSGIAANPANIILEALGGGWVFQPIMPGVYEVHTMFLPEGRGRGFFAAAKATQRWMFTQTDALEIVTKCPDDNVGARHASSTLGFRERFRREDAWRPGVGVSYRVFSVDDWFVRDKECLTAGHAFHEALEAAKLASGSTLPVHADDEAHDRAVGAAALMIRGGYMAKAVAFYCRWATFAGYATIEALSPTLVDVRDAIVEVKGDGTMGVLICRSAPQLASGPPL